MFNAELYLFLFLQTYDGFKLSQQQTAFVPCYTVSFSQHAAGTNVYYVMALNTTLAGSVLEETRVESEFDVDEAQRSVANLVLATNQAVAVTGECLIFAFTVAYTTPPRRHV